MIRKQTITGGDAACYINKHLLGVCSMICKQEITGRMIGKLQITGRTYQDM